MHSIPLSFMTILCFDSFGGPFYRRNTLDCYNGLLTNNNHITNIKIAKCHCPEWKMNQIHVHIQNKVQSPPTQGYSNKWIQPWHMNIRQRWGAKRNKEVWKIHMWQRGSVLSAWNLWSKLIENDCRRKCIISSFELHELNDNKFQATHRTTYIWS